MKAIVSFRGSDVAGVLVNLIDLLQVFDQVEGVAFVSSKLRPYRMSIDCDPQSVSPVSLLCFKRQRARGDLLALCSRSLRFVGLLPARIALTNAGGFAAESAQVIELGAADASSFDQVDVIDDRGV